MSGERSRCEFDISGFGVQLSGLPAACAARLSGEWSAFAGRSAGDPLLLGRVRVAGAPVPDGTVTAKTMDATYGHGEARFSAREGEAAVRVDGAASVRLAPSGVETQLYALQNLLHACLAWLLPRKGALMVHAAGIVLRDRALLLVGPEGSGKTTWLTLARDAGAAPLSDDINLLDASGDGVAVLGSPLRAAEFGTVGPGRWPLGAILLPDHGAPPRLAPVTGLAAQARLLANLPFLAETLGDDAGASAVVDRVLKRVPVRRLTFGREPSFVDLLARFLRGGTT